MTIDEFKSITEGDVVRNIVTGQVYLVVASYYCHKCDVKTFTVQRIITMSNPNEWEIAKRSNT